jgi:hypothetical protein
MSQPLKRPCHNNLEKCTVVKDKKNVQLRLELSMSRFSLVTSALTVHAVSRSPLE